MSKRAEFFMEGREMLAEPYHYVASGLDNIYLLNGVSIENTPYGEMVTIENLNGLHLAIGLHIMGKQEKMSGPEFRFLRKQMGLTQKELANALKVSDQTVANYEKTKTKDLGPADPYLRLSFLLHIVPAETRADLIKGIAEKINESAPSIMPDVPRRTLVQNWQEQPELSDAA